MSNVILVFLLGFLTSCSPSWMGLADDVFDNAITVSLQKESIQPKTDVFISVEIKHAKENH